MDYFIFGVAMIQTQTIFSVLCHNDVILQILGQEILSKEVVLGVAAFGVRHNVCVDCVKNILPPLADPVSIGVL